MCLGIPGEVVDLLDNGDLATIDVNGVRRAVNVGLVRDEGLRPGDWVLVHVGFAMSKIDESEAQATLQFLAEMMGEELDTEMDALKTSDIAWTDRGGHAVR